MNAPSNAYSFDYSKVKEAMEATRPPPRLVVYGEPKVGKTSFVSSAPDIVLLPTEDGSLGADVARLPVDGKIETWADMIGWARALITNDHEFKWAAIDTINGAEALCAQYVCDRDFGGVWTSGNGKVGFDSYGKGDKATATEFRALLNILDELQQKRDMGVIILAHVGLHKTGNALGDDFQKFGGNVNKHTWALIAGWADQIGFATREFVTSTREGERRAKAQAISSNRYIQFEGGPGLDAGGRVGYEMPERIPLSWEDYAAALAADWLGELVTQVNEMMPQCPDTVQDKISKRFNGKVTNKKLRSVGKAKLETLLGWMIRQQKKTSTNTNKEAA